LTNCGLEHPANSAQRAAVPFLLMLISGFIDHEQRHHPKREKPRH
jgi:surface polysaccharide O-acyltransferase-like enzyme